MDTNQWPVVLRITTPKPRHRARSPAEILPWIEGLIGQRECVHCVVACGYDVLFPIYCVSHRAAPHSSRTAHAHMPQRLAGLRIERDKDAVPATPEHHATGGGEHAALGIIDHLEFPLLIAGLRIECVDCPIPIGRGPISAAPAAHRHTRNTRAGAPILRSRATRCLRYITGPASMELSAVRPKSLRSFAKSSHRRAQSGDRRRADIKLYLFAPL